MPRLSFPAIDVRDVAALHLAVMDIPAAGGRRVLGSAGLLGMPAMARLLRKHFPEAARRVPRITLPDWIARAYALVEQDLKDNIEFVGKPRPVNAGRAKILLGRPLIGANEAFVAMARTMIERDLVSTSST